MKNLFFTFVFVLFTFVSYAQEKSTNFYIEPNISLWMPGLESYDHNHNVSLQFGLEVGKSLVQWEDLSIAAGLGLQASPQKLEQHLADETALILQLYLNGRIAYDIRETSTAFAQLGLGIVHELAEEEDGHAPPKMKASTMLGIGYQYHLNEKFHIGTRLDVTYPKGSNRRVSWVTLGAMIGLKF